jgi:hypothetical protein
MWGPQQPVPYGKREVTLLGVGAAYFALVTLSIADIIPLRTYVQIHETTGFVGAMIRRAMQLPYIGHVRDKMLEIGSPAAAIHTKLDFIAASFVIMALFYAAGLLVAAVIYLAQGIRIDPVTQRFKQLPGSGLPTTLVGLLVMFGGVAFMLWIVIDGFSELLPAEFPARYADNIVRSDLSIFRAIIFSELSLLAAILMIRMAFCYLGVLLDQVAPRPL